jgi:hypothetical protein
LRGLINEKSLRAVVGHESVEMSDRYTHETDEDLLLVGNAVISVFKGQENQSYIEQKIEESRDDT